MDGISQITRTLPGKDKPRDGNAAQEEEAKRRRVGGPLKENTQISV